MATVNAVGNSLTGSTGSGAFVGATSPTLVTPALDTPSSGILTNCTGLPSGAGILCTATNNNASAGQLGEYQSSILVEGSALSVTSNTPLNITSLPSLSAGDWDVWGVIYYKAAATTTVNVVYASCSSTSATPGSTAGTFANTVYAANVLNTYDPNTTQLTPMQRFSLSSATTIYLVGLAVFNVSTMTAWGGIFARRPR